MERLTMDEKIHINGNLALDELSLGDLLEVVKKKLDISDFNKGDEAIFSENLANITNFNEEDLRLNISGNLYNKAVATNLTVGAYYLIQFTVDNMRFPEDGEKNIGLDAQTASTRVRVSREGQYSFLTTLDSTTANFFMRNSSVANIGDFSIRRVLPLSPEYISVKEATDLMNGSLSKKMDLPIGTPREGATLAYSNGAWRVVNP